MSGRRTNAQIDADALREAADVLRAYVGPPATINVLEVIADSIEAGRRRRTKARPWEGPREESDEDLERRYAAEEVSR